MLTLNQKEKFPNSKRSLENMLAKQISVIKIRTTQKNLNNMLKLKDYKKTLTTLAFALACLLLYFVFPTQDVSQGITSLVIFFVIIPLIFGKIIEKRDWKNLGLTIGDWKKGLLFYAVYLPPPCPARVPETPVKKRPEKRQSVLPGRFA